MHPKILLVEDDQILGYALKTYLEMHNFNIIWKQDGLQGKDVFQKEAFDLCLLDVMMPKMDGFQLAEEIKKEKPETPLIFLTARSMKIDKLQGFQKGADDYIVKPVDEEELIARIHAVLKRTQPQKETSTNYEIGSFTFDWRLRRLYCKEANFTLTEKEADLLRMLCESKNQLLDRKDILQSIWGDVDYFNRRSMDVHIAKLRKYLQNDLQVKIINIHGKGYILEDNLK